MSRLNTDVIKKSIKHLMMISGIAILWMVAMSSMPFLNTSGLDYNLISNDNNSGSIETHSVYSCDGEAKTCVNTNQDNNNVVANNTAVVTPGPEPEPDCEAGIACIVNNLNTNQLGNLKFVLGLPVTAPNELLCDVLDDLTAAELRAALTAPVVGVTDPVATVIINCLIDAGFTNLE